MPYMDEYDVTKNQQAYTDEVDGDFEFNVVAASNSYSSGAFLLTVWYERSELSEDIEQTSISSVPI